ncbi:hypothetical protein [Xanthomonas tesorieronis]|uniref:hypothetical protein n=1 Tax=Xanthomonas tesorieronis TaxID=3160839 RepID=UPI003518F5C0
MESTAKAQCRVCKERFDLDAQQRAFVMPLLAKGQRFIMIECPCSGASSNTSRWSLSPSRTTTSHLSLPASTLRGTGRLDRYRVAAILGPRRVRQRPA